MDPQIKRPTAQETEEDLLRYQEQFLASKTKLSAEVIRHGEKRKPSESSTDSGGEKTKALKTTERDVVKLELPDEFAHTTTAPPVKKSKLKKSAEVSGDRHHVQEHMSTTQDSEEMLDMHDTHVSKILSEIVERDIDKVPVYYPHFPAQHGFPMVLHRSSQDQMTQPSATGQKKKSLFAQQFAHSSAEQFGITRKEQSYAPNKPAVLDVVAERKASSGPVSGPSHDLAIELGHKSRFLATRGTPEEIAGSVHSENLAKMAAMSDEEILAEQKKLLEVLDPSLVQFLKDRKPKGESLRGTAEQEDVKRQLDNAQGMEVDAGQPPANCAGKKEAKCAIDELPVKPDKKWVNMDKVEYEKLAWMDELPAPGPPDPKTGQAARFNFQGHLVAADDNLPTHLGLHHHGDEPERAGYALGELFQLARSANMQQRVMALKCLSCIIHNARLGEFHESLSAPIIPSLLDGGLIFIIRWALDDSMENSMAAAVQILHALLVCKADEVAAGHVFHWYRGHELPEVASPNIEDEEGDVMDAEKVEKTEADILKQDVLKGLLRMSLLPRLRYILEVWRPSATVVKHILDILTRIARHSTQAAYEVYQCSRLLEMIFTEFLPSAWSLADTSQQLTSLYGLPVPAALKLIRVICAAGRNMAASLISKYKLMDFVARVMAQDPSQLQLHPEEAHSLFIESYRTWQTCLQYGLATQHFGDLYSVLISSVQGLSSVHCLSRPEATERGCALITLLETVTHVGAAISNYRPDPQTKEQPAVPLVNWSHVTGLREPMKVHLQRCLKEFVDCYFQKKYDLSFGAASLNFMATMLSHCSQQPGYDPVETLQQIEEMCETTVLPLLKAQAFGLTLTYLRERSVLLWCDGASARKEDPTNLPELGSLLGAQAKQCPVLHSQSTVHFLLALTRLLFHMGKLHKGIVDKVFPVFLQHDELLQYVRKVCRCRQSPLAGNHWARFEHMLMYYVVKMACIKGWADMKLYHQLSLILLTHLHQGDEHLAHDLFSTVIFNIDFLRDLESEVSLTNIEEQLQLEESQQISSAAQNVSSTGSRALLIKDSCSSLGDIRADYLTVLTALSGQLHRSRARWLHDILNVDRSITGTVGQLLVPVDWPFLPLVQLYNNAVKETAQEATVPRSVVSMVTDTLRWVHLLESWRPTVLHTVTLATKLSRLMCTFLAGSDLFLNAGIHQYLEALLRLYCKPELLDRLDLEENIPGLTSFYDLYMLVLAQYQAVSFGDALFGCYILLPLQQRHSVLLRRAVWGEHANILRSLFVPIREVPIPLGSFLAPEEEHLELLRLYFQSLLSGSVSPRWCPLPYLLAVHHVNRFFYTQDHSHNARLRTAMIKQILQCQDQVLQRHLLYYKKANKDCEFGLELYDELPSIRKDTLAKVSRKSMQ